MTDLLIAGNFPPPLTGQAVATEVLASLIADHFSLSRVDLGAERAIPESIGDWWQRGLGYIAAARLLDSVTGCDIALWANPSPSAAGLLRDAALYRRLWADPRRPVLAISHWGNFHEAFAGPRSVLAHHVFRNVTGIIVLTNRLADALNAARPPCDVHVIPNTVRAELEPNEGTLRRSVKARAAALDSGRLRLGFVGRLLDAKGVSSVLATAARLRDMHPDVECLLVGPPGSPDDRDALEATIERQGLRGTVMRVSYDDPAALAECLRTLHVVALPSRYPIEAQPLVLIEAMANGAVPVASNQGGIRETIPAGPGGHVYAVEDFVASAVGLLSGYLEQTTSWATASAAARQHYDREFSRAQATARWLDVILTATN